MNVAPTGPVSTALPSAAVAGDAAGAMAFQRAVAAFAVPAVVVEVTAPVGTAVPAQPRSVPQSAQATVELPDQPASGREPATAAVLLPGRSGPLFVAEPAPAAAPLPAAFTLAPQLVSGEERVAVADPPTARTATSSPAVGRRPLLKPEPEPAAEVQPAAVALPALPPATSEPLTEAAAAPPLRARPGGAARSERPAPAKDAAPAGASDIVASVAVSVSPAATALIASPPAMPIPAPPGPPTRDDTGGSAPAASAPTSADAGQGAASSRISERSALGSQVSPASGFALPAAAVPAGPAAAAIPAAAEPISSIDGAVQDDRIARMGLSSTGLMGAPAARAGSSERRPEVGSKPVSSSAAAANPDSPVPRSARSKFGLPPATVTTPATAAPPAAGQAPEAGNAPAAAAAPSLAPRSNGRPDPEPSATIEAAGNAPAWRAAMVRAPVAPLPASPASAAAPPVADPAMVAVETRAPDPAPRPTPGDPAVIVPLPAAAPAPVAAAAPPSPAAVPMPYRPASVARDTGVLVAHKVLSGGNELTIRIEPAELGRIDVRMSFDDGGKLRATVGSDNPVVLDLLRRDVGHLVGAMTDAGVSSDQRSFRFEAQADSNPGGRAWSSSGEQPREQRRAPERQYASPPPADEHDPATFQPIRWAGRIDVTA